MKKIKLEYVIGIVVALILVGSFAFIYQKQANVYKNAVNEENKVVSDKRANKEKLDKLDFPQLSDEVKKDESVVTLQTSEGDIKIKIFDKYTPLAAENFVTHAKDGYYNGTIFHRVMQDFMIQGGDPEGTGRGGESIWNGKDKKKDSGNGFKNEANMALYNIRGAVSMANAGPDTNGSQFFINQNKDDQGIKLDKNEYPTKILEAYKKGGNPMLDGSYTVFGQVIEGMDVVDKIAASKVEDGESGEKSKPVKPVKITGAVVEQEAQVEK
ncbi:peptidylprolyl isomerase [Weissella tructae]|uniref:Peptidyl-prolyl cis-trans isomerase n=1 Tax=Weissella tructae TaxID=887702 RepID=A0ABM5QQY6_9LACO|nr:MULTISPECIES: peptidylprolyl isomerase [Weissella]AIG65126.1 Peptidyl-prolyl cis-trans isomerase [Weissella tructae]ELA07891.1 peptidyl-prolyl cis-trans isomerase [Weissella ceti NC36]